jgi:hypothetical protein
MDFENYCEQKKPYTKEYLLHDYIDQSSRIGGRNQYNVCLGRNIYLESSITKFSEIMRVLISSPYGACGHMNIICQISVHLLTCTLDAI